MNPNPDDPCDADLVALVHGELAAGDERALRARLATDADLRARHAALLAADRALAEELETPRASGRRLHTWWRPLLAAAALVVVGLVIALPRNGQHVSAAHNDIVGLEVAVHHGAQQPLFTDAALEFAWQNRLAGDDARRLKVLPYRLADTVEALARAEAADPENARSVVPLVVTAVLHAPDGSHIPARLVGTVGHVQHVPHLQIERLSSFEIETDAPPPYLGGRPGEGEWVDDFGWALAQVPNGGPRRWLLDQIGEWTIELRIECLPPPTPGQWPTFAEPLVVATKVIATGLVSDWGPTVDGLQARVVLATGCADLERAPLVLQLRNVSDRTRRYNVVGVTQAEIPQPFHFRLLLGGQDGDPLVAYEARPGLGVLIDESVLMVPHPGGTIRSLVVRADYWRNGRAPLLDLNAVRTLQMQFHFRPTAWSDLELWQGELSTGRLQLPPPAVR
jgi:hypothetical protein